MQNRKLQIQWCRGRRKHETCPPRLDLTDLENCLVPRLQLLLGEWYLITYTHSPYMVVVVWRYSRTSISRPADADPSINIGIIPPKKLCHPPEGHGWCAFYLFRHHWRVVTISMWSHSKNHGLFIKLLAKRTSGHRIAFSGGGVLGQNSFAKPKAIKSEPSISNPSIGQASRQGVVSSKGQRIPRRSHMIDVSNYRFGFDFDHVSFFWS